MKNEVHIIASNKDKDPSSASWSNKIPYALLFPLVARRGNCKLRSGECCPLCWTVAWILASPMTGPKPGDPCGDPQVVSVVTNRNISDTMETTPSPNPTLYLINLKICYRLEDLWGLHTQKHAGKIILFCLVKSMQHASKHTHKCVFLQIVCGKCMKIFYFFGRAVHREHSLCVWTSSPSPLRGPLGSMERN